MKKYLLLGGLLVLAGGAAWLGTSEKADFFSDLWSQVFWLVVGTIVTTFVLEQVLQADDAARRRNEDAFALRTFVGTMISSLRRIANLQVVSPNPLLGSTLFEPRAFATVALIGVEQILESNQVSPAEYDARRLDIESGLRDLSRNHIRLFCSSRSEMVDQYQILQGLALRWIYLDALVPGFVEYTQSLDPTDVERARRQKATTSAYSQALAVVSETAKYLGEVVSRAASTRGVPSF
jgi:hypothetical protein